MNAAIVLGITSVCLLALVAGLLVAVGLELRALKPALRGAPLLAEKLTEQVLHVRNMLAQIKTGVNAVAPQLADADKVRQDLQYLCARAEELCVRLERETGEGTALTPRVGQGAGLEDMMRVQVEAKIEEIARSNGVAAYTPAKVETDPLEVLLAGLEAVAPQDTLGAQPVVKPVKGRGKDKQQPMLPVVV